MGGIAGLVVGSMLMLAPAARADDADATYDARIGGYTEQTNLTSAGSTGSYFALIVMSVICLSVLFKDAKRTHLD